MAMGKKLDDLRWKPMWTTHLGCIKGCLEYLGSDVSDAWLFGATGHAFVLNIHEVVCPSGPTAWKTERMFELGKNIGYDVDGVFTRKNMEDFQKQKEKAWEETKKALDRNIPCYGWELEIPEFYVVNGYDDEGYYYSGPQCDEGKGVKPWKELGETDIGVIEMYNVRKGEPSEDAFTIKQALDFALQISKSPEEWIFEKYKSGPEGYDLWMKALKEGKADSWGMAYNSKVWCECRTHAVLFLKEAKERVDAELAPLFDEAIKHYQNVSANIETVSNMFPFPPKGGEVEDSELCLSAAQYLKAAKDSEVKGLETLEKIASRL